MGLTQSQNYQRVSSVEGTHQQSRNSRSEADRAVPQRTLVVTEDYRTAFRKTLLATYFAQWETSYLESDRGKRDIEDHIAGRMIEFETVVVPWICEVFDLYGKSVLEIGCGTGSATVPIALRAASVRAYDISMSSIEAAKERARLLGVGKIDFRKLDAAWAKTEEGSEAFARNEEKADVVLLIALLEHLTISERMNALRATWKVLEPNGILVIYETPNRLAYYDWHTSFLPFFLALPDELAVLYANKSKRPYFSIDHQGDVVENLYRLGRGVSYHEFDLAIGLENFTVANDGNSRGMQKHRQGMDHPTYDRALRDIFGQYLPEVPLGFAKPSLDLVLMKRPALGQGAHATSLPTEAQQESNLRLQIEEYERQLGSQTELTLRFLRLTAENLVSAVRDPRGFRRRLHGWWNRRILKR